MQTAEIVALVIKGQPVYARVHATDCPHARGLEAAGYGPFEEIPLERIASGARRCGFCGGPERQGRKGRGAPS